jgi:hypothetical protein
MSLVLPSEKGSALTCEEYQNNILFSLDLANATGELNCSKINNTSLNTCLSETNVINTINANTTNNANAIGEIAQDLTDVQSFLQNNINVITQLVNSQNATIAEQAQQIASLINSFNNLDNTVNSFNSRLLSIEGRVMTLEIGIAMGIIVIWSGLVTSIPISWQLCDGTNGTPDLRNRFVVSAGSAYAVNSTGGSLNHIHTAEGSTGFTALSTSQMPAHSHGVNDPTHAHGVSDPGHLHIINPNRTTDDISGPGDYISNNVNVGHNNGIFNDAILPAVTGIGIIGSATNISIASAGGGAGHNHSVSTTIANASNLPPYYALAYIMKI